MQSNLSIIILAAGKGTRMKSSIPKVLHKMSGKEMLYYSIEEAKKLSDDIHVVLYHQAELVKSSMDKYFADITYHLQDHDKYPGTGGAVMGIIPKNEKVLVLNGDMPLIEATELKQLTENENTHKAQNQKLTMSVLNLTCADGYGRVIIEKGKVSKIIEQKDCSSYELDIVTANAGIYCFDTQFLLESLPKLSNDNAQKEFYITDLVEIAVNEDIAIKPVVVKEENFKGVNSKLDLANAEVIHQNRIKTNFLKAGITMKLPDTIFIEHGVTIEGETVLENGVTLLGNSKILNSVIKTNSIVEDAILENSEVGPMARIRPLSIIKDSHIGNFVEIKKSNLTGVKAGHLSYLGDSCIDEGTNVGAGTITCNYDGVNKYKTIIGKNVFIGSDTQLVAPVTIEDNSMIAAGSTITNDVKSGDLALSRTKQKTISGFFHRFFKETKKNKLRAFLVASFAQHVNTAVVISGISIAPLYSSSLIDINQAFVLLFFGMVGGILPDIDLENSKPIQITSSILSIFIPLLAILLLLESLSITKMLFIWFLSSMILHFLIFRILLHLTIHRGVIHSVPMGLLFAQILNILFYMIFEFSELFSILCGLFLFFGFLIHLLLDEIVSLNAFGMSFKKSLGSALKFYDKNNLIGTVFIYISIVVLQIIYPINIEHFFTIFKSFQNINM